MGTSPRTRRVVGIVEEGFDLLDLAGPLQVFAAVNEFSPRYHVVTASPGGGAIAAGIGVAIVTEALAAIDPAGVDTLLVIGGGTGSGGIPAWLARHAPGIRRLCGIGPGADALAASSLIRGDEIAVHWRRSRAESVDRRQAPIARRHGAAWTCAGASASLDLALALVAEDLGQAAAVTAAAALLMPVWRAPAMAQVGATLALQKRAAAPFQALLRRMRENPAADLRVGALAEWSNMSPRTFARRFARETGTTPAAAAVAIRMETAEAMLHAGRLTLKQVAALSGFGSELSLRRAFERSGRAFPRRGGAVGET